MRVLAFAVVISLMLTLGGPAPVQAGAIARPAMILVLPDDIRGPARRRRHYRHAHPLWCHV